MESAQSSVMSGYHVPKAKFNVSMEDACPILHFAPIPRIIALLTCLNGVLIRQDASKILLSVHLRVKQLTSSTKHANQRMVAHIMDAP